MSADVLSGRASVPASRSLPPDSCRLSLDDFVTANPVATSTVVVRKDVVLSVGGFDEQFRGPEDYDLWMRIVANNAVTYFDMPFGRYRRVAGSLSMNEKAFLPQVIRVIDKAFGEKGVFAGRPGKRKAIAHQVLAASWTAADRDELVRAWVLWLKSLIVWPFSFGSGERLSWVRTRLAFRFLKCALRGNECS
ncbi:MAG: hypothetical protein A2283_17140 [Lentisphaerae bacterium RIFOXYA12_FULL_48_11]|nr:MAG: hypothetical protein A2283_17140 [Lentisphaerae bacterium RIFOXYA12_FULL_48_11]